jgi:aminoglycoside phosphotransferase (APT) family kinase protein
VPSSPVIQAAPEQETLDLLVKNAMGATVKSVEPAGKGMLGYVFRVTLNEPPYKVIVKWQKYSGKAENEAHHLDALRKHSMVKVPEVYHVHLGSPEIPAEAMIMELVPGIQASSLVDPPMSVQEQIAEESVDVLLQWHSVENSEGYGTLDGPYFKRWSDFLRVQHQGWLDDVIKTVKPEELPPIIPEVGNRSLEAAEDILGVVEGKGVMIHSDYWLPNVLIDPETYHITGVLDPLGVRWDEPETEIVPSDWPWGDYQFLMKAYERRRPFREGWPLRFAFHRFWFMMTAVYLLGPGCAVGEAEALKKAMEENGIRG